MKIPLALPVKWLLVVSLLALAHLAPRPALAQGKTSKVISARPLNVAFLIYPGVEALDLSGPLDVFVMASRVKSASYNIYTVAAEKKPLDSNAGALTLTPRYSISNCPRPDILIVPGASEQVVRQLGTNPKVVQWIKRNASPSQTVMSVCTGAFLLGRAGLLDGKNSTTHWLTLDSLQSEFPKTKAFRGVKWMRDGNIVTTAGVSSGIDGAFFLIEKTAGETVAATVAQGIQYRRHLPAYPDSVRARVALATTSASPKTAQKLASNFDPVCGMKVSATTPYTVLYKGQLFGFCMAHCRDEFKKQPAKYLKTTIAP